MQTIAPTLTTERMILAPVSLEHWEAHTTMWADPRTSQFIGGDRSNRAENWIKFVAASGLWNLLGYGYWSFLDRESGAFLGLGGLSRWERGMAGLEGFIEAGWAFGPDAWGKGYATEAMKAALAWADQTLPDPEIRCIIDIENDASVRVGEKLGFKLLETSEGDRGPLGLYSRKAGG
jgi:RimJ/RimL family protein N-acetyltransferase